MTQNYENNLLNSELSENNVYSFIAGYLREYKIPVGRQSAENSPNTNKTLKIKEFGFFVRIKNHFDIKGVISPEGINLFNKIVELPVISYIPVNSKTELNNSHLIAGNLCSVDELRSIEKLAVKCNSLLRPYFLRRNHHLLQLDLYFISELGSVQLKPDFNSKQFLLTGTENVSDNYIVKRNKITDINSIINYLKADDN